MINESEHAAFEEWALREGLNIRIHPASEHYQQSPTYYARKAWQARAQFIAEQDKAEAVARPMESAPRDGRMLQLLVQFEEHATEDTLDPAWTIGSNSFDENGEDNWQFAGWCWSHDHFTEGKGTPVGWSPMIDDKTAPSTDRVGDDRRALRERSNANNWTGLAASMYQAAGAFDMPVRILDALSLAQRGENFNHLIDGLLPCYPSTDRVCDQGDSETLAQVIAEMRAREATGITKYSKTMDRTDLTHSQWRQHLREELMDAILYLKAEERTAQGGEVANEPARLGA